MAKSLTGAQKAKVAAGKAFMRNYTGDDTFYQLVVIIGPSLFGSFFQSNSDTVWSRVENPGQFRLEEMITLTIVFDITMEQFLNILEKQISHNRSERMHSRLIGREKYQNNKQEYE